MTDQPIDIRVELKDLLATVDGNVQITRDQMDAINDHLGVLWGKAHDAGDKQAMTLVQNTWDRVLSLVEQNSSLAFQVTGMGSIATAALEGERATRAALDELEDAIESGDEDHPKLADFAQTVRYDAQEDAEDYFNDYTIPELYEHAYEEQNDYLSGFIQTLTNCSRRAADLFICVLDNTESPTEEELDLLKQLLTLFEAKAEKERVHNRILREQAAQELREWNDAG